MNTENLDKKVDSLKKSIDTLILIEIAKSGATREQARRVLGGLSNSEYAKVNALFSKSNGKK